MMLKSRAPVSAAAAAAGAAGTRRSASIIKKGARNFNKQQVLLSTRFPFSTSSLLLSASPPSSTLKNISQKYHKKLQNEKVENNLTIRFPPACFFSMSQCFSHPESKKKKTRKSLENFSQPQQQHPQQQLDPLTIPESVQIDLPLESEKEKKTPPPSSSSSKKRKNKAQAIEKITLTQPVNDQGASLSVTQDSPSHLLEGSLNDYMERKAGENEKNRFDDEDEDGEDARKPIVPFGLESKESQALLKLSRKDLQNQSDKEVRWGMFGDIHFQDRGLSRVVSTGEWILDAFKDQQVTDIICLGDVLNTRESVSVQSLSAALKFMDHLASVAQLHVILGSESHSLPPPPPPFFFC